MDEMLLSLLAPPVLSEIRRALFIQPHPDDNEIGAGGTMALLSAQGAEIWSLTVTDDRAVCPPEAVENGSTLRQREALAAQEVLGAKHAGFLGFTDKTDAGVEMISAAIVPIIRRLQPDAVFSVDPELKNECHRDHIKVGMAVRFAVMDAAWPQYQPSSERLPSWETPILGQYLTGEPNTIADIGDFMEKKLRAVSRHRSQVSPELLALIEAQATWFGTRAGVRYGEALKLLRFAHLHCFNLPIG